MSEEQPLGDLSDLVDGELRAFSDIGRHGIVVCRMAGELYALDDQCSHAEAALSEGRLTGANLVCPLHGAGFDVRDGSHQGPPAWEGVACHSVVEEPDGARVTLTASDPSSARDADGGQFRTR